MTPMAQALSTALLHFIWQGIAGQVLLGIALLSLRKSSANSRYFASCIVLAILAVAPLVTVWAAYPAAPVSAELAVGAPSVAGKAAVASAVQGSVANRSFGSIDHWILPIWAAGVFVFALRLAWAAGHASSLRRRGIEADRSIESLVMGLAGRLGIRRKLRVLVSSLFDVPSVVGWIRPIILLPAAVVVGLTPQQLEALLAHELAHIRRHDYVVNILQMVVETLLFYHPSVWWISSRIRHERELCCDDVAVSSCGNAVVYARALAQLERLRPIAPSLAVGSADGPLYGRIQRLLGSGRNEHRASRLASVACLLVGVLCVGVVISTARAQQDPIRTEVREPVQIEPIPPAPPVAPLEPRFAPAQVAPIAPMPLAPVAVSPMPATFPALPALAPVAVAPVAMPVLPAPQTLSPQGLPVLAPVAVAPVAMPVLPAPQTLSLQRMPALAPLPTTPGTVSQSPLLLLPLLQSLAPTEGDRWVLFKGTDVIGRGSASDVEQARKARQTLTGDLLWFRLDGKAYVTQDKEVLDQIQSAGDSLSRQRDQDLENAVARLRIAEAQVDMTNAAQRQTIERLQVNLTQLNENLRAIRVPDELSRQPLELQAENKRIQALVSASEAQVRQSEAQLRQSEAQLRQGEAQLRQSEAQLNQIMQRINEAVDLRSFEILREAVRTGKAQPTP